MPKIKWRSLMTSEFTKGLISIVPTLVATILGEIVILLFQVYLVKRF
ncbi:hypothetical protein [Peribacillus sp. NPDC096540]